MPYLLSPIVGTHFRPPAGLILTQLPVGTELILSPEPDNPYDPNAVRIELDGSSIPYDKLDPDQLLSCGWTVEALRDEYEGWKVFHLGYIAASQKTATIGQTLYKLNTDFLPILAGAPDHQATLTFSPEGRALVKLEYQ